MGVGEADCGEGVACPGVGLGHVGRAGETGADVVRQAAGELHDVGVLEALLADAGVHGEIDVFGGRLRAVVGGDFGFGLLFGLGFRVFLGEDREGEGGEGGGERQSAGGEDQSRLLEARGVSLKDSRGSVVRCWREGKESPRRTRRRTEKTSNEIGRKGR